MEDRYLSFFDSHDRSIDWPFFDPNGLLPTWHLLSALASSPPSARILIIGDYSLRDTTFLRKLGFHPDLLDLERPPRFQELPGGKFIQANLDDSREFSRIEGPYDFIVFCEVMEHLFHDAQALAFLRSRLSEKGLLIFSTPLINPLLSGASDRAPFHVQVYTPRQLERLFAHAGFASDGLVIRGFGCNFWYTLPVRGLVWGLRRSMGDRRTFALILKGVRRLHSLGKSSCLFRWLSMWSWAYGCLATLRPSDSKIDFESINRQEFLSNQNAGHR